MLDGIRNALLILNPQAGRARNLLSGQIDGARATLAGQGIATELAVAGPQGEAEEMARRAVLQGKDLVIACGGDGTLNAIINGLAGSDVPLALLPAGTANILAKELSLPWDIERAAGYIKHGTLRSIALGLVSTWGSSGGVQNRYFLSVAGAGPDGAMVHAVDQKLKSRAGMLAFWLEGVRQLALYNFPQFRVTAGGRTRQSTFLVVGRTKHYGGPLRITTQADLFGSDFELMVCETRSRMLYLAYIPLACAGRMRWAPKVRFLRATAFRCEPVGAAAWLQVDGEPAGRLPAEFRIVPDALKLVVPGIANGAS
jgi:diacylglycerol kinase (ATP)